MYGLYSIIKCPKCGIDIPIRYGHFCGIGAEIEFDDDTICRNKFCMEKFKIDVVIINQNKCVMVDWNDFKSNDSGLVGIDSYNSYCEQLLEYIKINKL
jgi:hypothetical protein